MSRNIRKVFLLRNSVHLAFCIWLILLSSGCNTRIEGCLDASAKNFDLNAERPCDGCCAYPSITLSLSQKWDDRNFANTDTLYDIHLHPYKIQDLKYFLTTWAWTNSTDGVMTVDSVEADCNDETLRYTPDNLVIDSRQFVYTLGTFRQSPLIDSLQCTLGLSLDFSCLDKDDPDTPPALTDQSPLWNAGSSSLETIRLIIQPSLDNPATDTVYLKTRIDQVLQYSLGFTIGFDTEYQLTVNYARWFRDVDINDISTFETSLLNNFNGSINRAP